MSTRENIRLIARTPFNVRTSHMFSLRDPYILFLEVILKFKSQSYKSQKKKKISGLFININ